MASQFTPAPGPGYAPLVPQPSSPRGLYREFGAPESLLRIHFPRDPNNNPTTANPWYWYIVQQRPYYFSFLAPQGGWGPGWVRRQIYPVIKILPIDTQPEVPTTPVGYTSVQDAIARSAGQDLFGRFDPRDQRFWDLILQNGNGSGKNASFPFRAKPPFNVVKGQVVARDGKTNVNAIIKQAVNQFSGNFNSLAAAFNSIASGVDPSNGFHYSGQPSPFNFTLPDVDTTIAQFEQELEAFTNGPPYGPDPRYIGPVSGTDFFNIGTFTRQATAFNIAVGQLDPKKWNMSVFPPLDSTLVGNGSSSFISQDYSGFGQTPFPLHGLEIM